MLRYLLHGLVDFLEVIGFIAAILLAGLALAIGAFRMISWVLSLFGVNTENSGPYELEDDDFGIDDYDVHDDPTPRAVLPRPIAPSSNDPKPPSH